MPRNIVKILSAATACILLLGCGNDGGESAATDSSTEIPTSIEIVPTPTPAGDVDNADLSVKPLVIIPSSSPPTELLIEDLVVGSGSPVGVGDFLVMDYVVFHTQLGFNLMPRGIEDHLSHLNSGLDE